MFYQVLEDEWKKKTKKLNFFLLSWPKRKQMETTKKDSWCDITWCVVPLPKPLLLPDGHEQPQSKNWLRWKTQTDWQIPYQGFQTLEILSVFYFKGSFLQYPHPHINLPPLPSLCTKLTQSLVIKWVIFGNDERQAKMMLNRIHAVSLKINVGETWWPVIWVTGRFGTVSKSPKDNY